MCRGNQGQSIFKDDQDRQRYIDLLKESQQRFGYQLYAYVLMGNHVHHLVEIDQTPLSKVMQNGHTPGTWGQTLQNLILAQNK